MTQNSQCYPVPNISNLFPPKWLRITQNSQFHLIPNFSNLFPPKSLRMTWNIQFCMAKKEHTMIQGNFYERLNFYMDSWTISLWLPCLITFNFWWSAEQSEQWKSPKMLKKWPPKWSKNEMLVFRLRSTYDEWLSNLSNKVGQNTKKWPPNHQKNEMLVFGLCSISDDLPSNKSHPKCEK